MPPQARVGDRSLIPADAHGCPACPHVALGPAVAGSANVLVNGRPAVRINDPGIHTACCGPNIWNAKTGSRSVLINGRSAHRLGDSVTHCGGIGNTLEGSSNVFVGGATSATATRANENSLLAYDGFFSVIASDGSPVSGISYRITGSNIDISGITDELGHTSIITTGSKQELLKFELTTEPLLLSAQPNY